MITIRLKKRKKYTTIYLDISHNGERWWENTNLYLLGDKGHDKKAMELAESIRAKRMIELSSDMYGVPRNANKDFLKYYESVIKEKSNLERKATTFKHLKDYAVKNNIQRLTFSDINEKFWEKFKRYLREDAKHAPYTIFMEFGTLKTVLNRAIREKIINENPLRYVKERQPKTTRTFLEWEEVEKLYNTPCTNEIVKNAFLFSCYTGLRLSDIETLKKKYFTRDKIIFPRMEKTDNAVVIEYETSTLELIPDFDNLKPDDNVFNLPNRSIIHTTIKGWTLAAGITKNISYHSSRHTFVTGILTYYNGDIATAGALAGHSDTRTTQIYAHIIDRKKKEAISSLPKMKKMELK